MTAQDTKSRWSPRSTSGAALYMLTGPIVWAIHLTIIYGAHTLLCTRGFGTEIVLGAALPVLVIAAVTAVALLFLIAAVIAPRILRGRVEDSIEHDPIEAFHDGIMRWLALLSMFGIAWAGATALIVSPCLAMR